MLGPLGTSATTGLLYLPRVIVMVENLVEWELAGETEVLGETCPSATLSTRNSTCQTRVRSRAVAVGSQRLTAWVMARPKFLNNDLFNGSKQAHDTDTS
jgi:hypothetical protein